MTTPSTDSKLKYARVEKYDQNHYLNDDALQFDVSIFDNSSNKFLYSTQRDETSFYTEYQNTMSVHTVNDIKTEVTCQPLIDGNLEIEPSISSLGGTDILSNKGSKVVKFYCELQGTQCILYPVRRNNGDPLVNQIARFDSQINDIFTGVGPICERRLILFVNKHDINELTLHIGYITEKSKYIAPHMFLTELGYWINYGPIYGSVEITTLDDNFFMTFTRDYISGKLSNQLTRSTFIPTKEGPGNKEYPVIINNEKLYTRHYSPQDNGELVTVEELAMFLKVKRQLINQYLIDVLCDLMGY